MKKTLKIEGMQCENCVNRLQKALNALPGVTAKVDLASKTAAVSSEKDLDDAYLRDAVEKTGFEVTEIL